MNLSTKGMLTAPSWSMEVQSPHISDQTGLDLVEESQSPALADRRGPDMMHGQAAASHNNRALQQDGNVVCGG